MNISETTYYDKKVQLKAKRLPNCPPVLVTPANGKSKLVIEDAINVAMNAGTRMSQWPSGRSLGYGGVSLAAGW